MKKLRKKVKFTICFDELAWFKMQLVNSRQVLWLNSKYAAE